MQFLICDSLLYATIHNVYTCYRYEEESCSTGKTVDGVEFPEEGVPGSPLRYVRITGGSLCHRSR